ncbi:MULTISPECIES: glutathione S-transferase [unclassified Burkholderia]|uniref:glutathione S-transferase family protein n=1 Tax=unclassified Burkholderia TaxID=2613784 RepID=UPI0014233EFE|nr:MULTISPECIES: glutathione S-transferase [unclassified Burkholderia]NIE82498.1 glutathione S-transferase family protein [Burkholderia sp. Tr-860]NIF64052.1 glutathione S-transferase family protein [Burkholderia sp. Cy-647]NIF69139.1 glutathione S-transferase family protein [Burkholderia sp. Ap-962]NIF88514.1 glutathione S-transferase family protein [Burkholderia sp. Cy-637]NIF96353.1 glutathione S-transferase family protein [Burkholderia sp. Ax-1720]
MLQLCGLPLSNYYNKVKLVLLDHEIDFEEQIHTLPLSGDEALDASPFGKVPFLRTEHGSLSESQAIVEYLAARYPEKGLFPADPFEAAKVREITVFVELYLEWVARSLYGLAFFGGTASEETQRRVEKRLVGALAAFRKMTRFAPYVLGETYGMADVAAYIHLPIVGLATKAVYGRDLVVEAGIDWKAYSKLVGERPAAQRVTADRKAYLEANGARR